MSEHEHNGGVGSLGLGIDVGSTNTKVALVDLERASVLQVRAAVTPDDALRLVDTVLRLVRDVVGQSPAMPAVVGIASMAETGVPLDFQGAPLTTLLRWNEARGTESADALVASLGRESLFAATGVQPGPKAPLATWAWLRHTHPEVWVSMYRWAGVSELIALALTGEFATDHTLAGRTMAYLLPDGAGLPAAFDADLLDAVGLRAEQLPRVLGPGESVGPVTRGASERSGLNSGTPVFIAGHDHAVGSWAAGVRHPGDVADSVGTAEALVRVLAHPVAEKAALACGMSLTRTVTGEYESLLAGSASSGSFVRWFSDTHLDGHDPADLLHAAGTVSLEPSGVVVLPYLRGRQSPAPDPDARVRVLDTGGRTLDPASCSRERLAHALFEALAFQVRWMDAEQRRLGADAALSTLVVLGGPGAQSPAALAVKSAVLGARLDVVTVAEPVACGAALLAASRLGVAVSPLPRRAVEPAPGLAGRYDQSYTTFVAAASASPQGEQ